MKIRVILKSFDNNLINVAFKQINSILIDSNYKSSGIVSLPTRIKRFCVLRSPHVDKNSREHFEIRILKKFIDFKLVSPLFLKKISKIEFPSGIYCSLKIL